MTLDVQNSNKTMTRFEPNEIHNAEKNLPSLSETLYGFRWSDHFPITLNNGFRIEIGNYKRAAEFYRAHFKQIYDSSESSRFLAEEFSEAKTRYYRTAGDFFFFVRDDRVCGVFVGTPVDWSTYFFRNCSILPEYQGQKNYQVLLKHLLEILKESGIDRVEGIVSPSNLGHIHILNKFQFNVVGIQLSERWGASLQFTKFLNPIHEQLFLDSFCHGVRPQQARDFSKLKSDQEK